MSTPRAETAGGSDGRWRWPVDPRCYDTTPVLSGTEAAAISGLGADSLRRPGSCDPAAGQWRQIRRLARPLDDRERSVAQREYQDFLRYYDGNPDDAKKLIAFGDSKADDSLAPAELAAMTMLVNQLMNLDEVLNK